MPAVLLPQQDSIWAQELPQDLDLPFHTVIFCPLAPARAKDHPGVWTVGGTGSLAHSHRVPLQRGRLPVTMGVFLKSASALKTEQCRPPSPHRQGQKLFFPLRSEVKKGLKEGEGRCD